MKGLDFVLYFRLSFGSIILSINISNVWNPSTLKSVVVCPYPHSFPL